ncbi:FHA domain-containing protein [Thermosynechococcaceae cyanobacterium BACA0444]|uniref:FHA domain-containing protein n=1 Tax=Pseudocalidococcus azoricus BACA0444 TaxID=2918990 RepID=A0AAE4FVT8_9CYAN|nr:FHA domain-containing protein [Pseudocalidococcus azoricus]MDS3862239.1 FHA domain-containing protein [Pseudocalidococcus azoricus BACA0444]
MKASPAWLTILKSAPDYGFPIAQDTLTIGRTPENTIILADRSVSRQHARIEWHNGGFSITDLGSTSGTRINYRPLSPHTSESLNDGDLIQIGDSVLRFSLERPEQSQPRASRVPSVLVRTEAWAQEFILEMPMVLLGSHSSVDILVDTIGIAPVHIRLQEQSEHCLITYLGDAPQGLMSGGQPVTEWQLRKGETINLGPAATLTYEGLKLPEQIKRERVWLDRLAATQMALTGDQNIPVATEVGLPEEVDLTTPMKTVALSRLNTLSIGRDSSNDLVIEHPSVSRFHAKIDRQQGSLVLTDLESCNGTFVNGKAITEVTSLRVGDVIRIGSDRLILNIDETLTQYVEAGHLRLDVVGLSKVIGDGKRILNDIPLSILPREFVAILGPSGSGKSTLLDALNGLRPATNGSVMINGTDLYQNYDAYKTQLGYVPQKNIIHEELTLFQALDYAAQLRMPPDTTSTERKKRIQVVLGELGLSHRADVPIRQLSGGQQRRACMGAELLTQPSLFFLDEVTSGLDPGTEADMMQLLRQLADQGRIILIISHATQNIRECDLVIYMAAGGYLAYFGPPERMLPYFRETFRDRLQGVPLRDFADLYRALDREKNPNAPTATELANRYQQSSLCQTFIANRQTFLSQIPKTNTKTTIRSPKKKQRRVSPWQQFLVLSQRNLTILRQDRTHLLLTLLIAPVLALLDFITWGRDIFDSAQGSADEALTMLFATALVAVMIGSMTTMRDLVREIEIYRRERMTGLQMLPYIFSKVAVALILAIYQAATYLLVTKLAVNIPGGWDITFQIYITIVLAIFGGMIMGLLVSAVAPNQNIVPLILLFFLVPQIIFSGGIQPLSSLGPVGQVLNRVTVLKWPYETLVSLSGLGRDVAKDACWQKTSEERDNLTEAQEKDCACFGESIFRQCNFPGIQKQYNSAVDQAEPPKPKSPGDPPSNPTELKSYSDDLKTYQEQMDTWQDDYTTWQKQRSKAINGAEELINQINKKQGHMFAVDVGRHWLYQGFVIVGMLILIPILQRRRDFS